MGKPEQQRAVAISAFDLQDSGQPHVHGCDDCACACTVNTEHMTDQMTALGLADPGATERWVRAADVREMAIDDGHWAAFNPAGDGGVVVLNAPARDILRRLGARDPRRRTGRRRPGGGRIARGRAAAAARGADPPDGTAAAPGPARVGDADRVASRQQRVQPALSLLLRAQVVGRDGRADRPRFRRRGDLTSAVAHGFKAVKLKYAGGEASLNSRLVLKLDAYAREHAAERGLDLDAVLLSNGVVLRPPFVEALASSGRTDHDLPGRRGRRARQPAALHERNRRFASSRRRSPSSSAGPPAAPVHHDHQPQHDGIADVVRFALERDLTFSLNFFRDNECAAGFADLRYDEHAMIAGMLAAFGVIEERLPRVERARLGTRPRAAAAGAPAACGVGQDYVVIDQRGQVAKCHMEIERTLGDVFRDDPLELVRRDTRHGTEPAVDEKEGCRDCTWRYWCAGGCPVATFAATGRYDVKSPNCAIYKAIYPEALRLEGLRLLKFATV